MFSLSRDEQLRREYTCVDAVEEKGKKVAVLVDCVDRRIRRFEHTPAREWDGITGRDALAEWTVETRRLELVPGRGRTKLG
jgi:hypothetical protein